MINEWHGVIPAHIEDAYYYYARIKAAASGDFFLQTLPYGGAHAIPPSWSVSEGLAALPLILSGSWGFTIIFNIMFWAIVSASLLYVLFRTFGANRYVAALGVVFAGSQLLLLMTRPVSMQVPYAAYLAILASLAYYLTAPSFRKAFFFIGAIVFGLFVYTFVGQVGILSGVLVLLLHVIKKENMNLRNFVLAGLVLLPLGMLFALIMFSAASAPTFNELLLRYGLVYTRTPSLDVFNYGRWLVLSLAMWAFLSRMYSWNSPTILFGVVSSVALLSSFFVHVITGSDIESAVHLGRMVFPLVAIHAVLVAVLLGKSKMKSLAWYGALMICIVLLGASMKNIYERNVVRLPNAAAFATANKYEGVLAYFRMENVRATVRASEPLAGLLLIHTDAKPLFTYQGGLYQVSDTEQKERYLLQKYPSAVSASTLEDEADDVLVNIPKHNDPATYLPAYLEEMLVLSKTVNKTYVDLMKKYSVEYYVLEEGEQLPKNLNGEEVYKDEGIIIMKLI